MSLHRVECVVKGGALIGEGPVWEESHQTLMFVDIAGKKLHRWNPAANQIETLETDDMVSMVVPCRSGGYLAGIGRNIVAIDWSTKDITLLAEVDEDKPNNRLNDGKVDPAGRLLVGTMAKEEKPTVLERQQGALFSVASDLTVTKLLSQVDISNGMEWSLDHNIFYYIDSLSHKVDAFDYDIHTGSIDNRRTVYHMEEGEGFPDGMTSDAEGHLWVACYNAGKVISIDPSTGVRLQTVLLPVSKPTSCCFGGPDYSDLYVTSARLGLSESESRLQPLAGHIFRVRGLGVKGRPSTAFSR